VTDRRFDTEALLEQLLKGDEEAFKAFYSRYRGRVYRYITRQCGNGEEGQAAYLLIWARLVDDRHQCNSGKSLKYAFLSNLQRISFSSFIKPGRILPSTLLPRELDEEGGWSTLLLDLLRKLPEEMRKRFLFRYEIGLSHKAIARIFAEQVEATEKMLKKAEHKLLEGLLMAGCSKQLSLDALYRETRTLNPPASWDDMILIACSDWISAGVPAKLLSPAQQPTMAFNRLADMKSTLRTAVHTIKANLREKISKNQSSTNQ
jgi:DNA-directed RNA polymerase specialized sigma24 family protein